jgi:LysR family nitrogen assimilation transcriptional regulator
MSEISGVQLNRMLVLATRSEPQQSPALTLVKDLVDAEISRLTRLGYFSFGFS